jgi:hypothetical protein
VRRGCREACASMFAKYRQSVLGWTGSDRLSRGLSRSTIGAGGFNGRVRNGIGWNSPARTTSPAKDASFILANMLSHASPANTLTRASRMHKDTKLICHCRLRTCLRMLRIAWPCFQTWNEKCLSVSSVTIERLGPVSSTHCCAYTPGLSTWSSSTALKRNLVLRLVSRLDAFSGYLFRT